MGRYSKQESWFDNPKLEYVSLLEFFIVFVIYTNLRISNILESSEGLIWYISADLEILIKIWGEFLIFLIIFIFAFTKIIIKNKKFQKYSTLANFIGNGILVMIFCIIYLKELKNQKKIF